MAFNSRSYYRNKAKRQALELLAQARDLKQSASAGLLQSWEMADRLPSIVRRARLSWQTYLSYLRLDRMDGDIVRLKNREISHADFMAKWDFRNKAD
jgi:hypothetical protein